MVITHDISNKKLEKAFELDVYGQLEEAYAKRKDFLNLKMTRLSEAYCVEFPHSKPLLLRYEGGLDGRILFDAIVKREGKLLSQDLASFIVTTHKPHDSYSLEVTVYDRSFQKYATIVAEEYEKKFGDEAMIFLKFKASKA